jgi:16S rRNA (adenine1518-N6/adenine1519-N6)-dimethyltransferase
MKLSEMKQLLGEYEIRLSKSLGQNFLHDGNQLRRIIEAAELEKGDRVLEVGPGLGPLTELLVQNAGQVLAIEKDARLVELLRGRFGRELRSLDLIVGDALEYLRETVRDWSEWKLVSNLPYSVASPILVELAQSDRGPQRMVVTLQMEVAKRLMAKPGEKDYGLLTLLVGLDYEPQKWFKIAASCFFPEPEVDSACVSLVRRPYALLGAKERELFRALVKKTFSQRRKMMLKLLKEEWPIKVIERAFEQLGLLPHIRAETVSLEQFVRLTRMLSSDSSRE